MTRRTRTLAAALALLGLLAGMAQGYRAVAPIDQPQFLQVEPVELGLGYPTALRLLKATWHSGHGLRAGISALDYVALDLKDEAGLEGWTFAPIHVGYDIILNPKRTEFFYGMVPCCFAEASFGAFPPCVKLGAACDFDYYGVGTGVEVGFADWTPAYSLARHSTFYASLKLRLLDAAFRLPGRR